MIKTELYEIYLSLGSYLDDIDTLESSDPARGLLISIVAQTKLSIAIVAPTIDLHTGDRFRLRTHSIKTLVGRIFCNCFELLLSFTYIKYCKENICS